MAAPATPSRESPLPCVTGFSIMAALRRVGQRVRARNGLIQKMFPACGELAEWSKAHPC